MTDQNERGENEILQTAGAELAEASPGAPSTPSSPSTSVHMTGLYVDNDPSIDEGLGDISNYSSTVSVRSSVYDYVEEYGRTYHRYRQGKYYLPNDEMEQERLDLQHHLFLLTLEGALYLAPLKDLPGGIHNVLDVATGTGIWAIEFANEFPSANVIGTDLSPIQPEFVAPNCHFQVDDADDPWTFSTKFDYIHGRALTTCFKSHSQVIESAFAALRPGGYLELQDCVVPFRCIDDSLTGTDLEKWSNLMFESVHAMGLDWSRVPKYKQYMIDAGFEDVVEKKYEWPLGTWAKGKRLKMLGLWYREDLLGVLQGVSMAMLTKGLKMSAEEVEMLLVGVREDIKSNKIHVYVPMRFVYGRKPT